MASFVFRLLFGVVFLLLRCLSVAALKPMLQKLSAAIGVQVRFTESWNPAASAYGPADFCENDNFGSFSDFP